MTFFSGKNILSKTTKLQLVLFVLLISNFTADVHTSAASNPSGIIFGKIIEQDTGDPLIGANVLVMGTTMGAATDLDGNYRISNVPAGSYSLRITYIGYETQEITDVMVKPNKPITINVILQSEVISGETVEVTAKAVRNTEAILLKDRQKAVSVSDAISSEAISRAGSGDAAQAMKQITGASVVDGKYVYIRGLGDRYTSTQLNGAEIPSTNPYKRAASVDIIPSNLLDNIVTLKSFTPDKPGDFSGGTVDIRTKDFPEELTINFSTSTSFNPQTNFNKDGAIFYPGGHLDWLGMDDGTRAIPYALPPMYDNNIPIINNVPEEAIALDRYTKSFNNIFQSGPETFPLNNSVAFSIGNQIDLFNRPFGFLASLTYNRSYSNYTDGINSSFYLDSHIDSTNTLGIDYDLQDRKSTCNVLLGTLLKAAYKISPLHKLSFNAIYNQNGESYARYMEGTYPYETGDAVYETNVIGYNERSMTSFQLDGDHQLDILNLSRISWKASFGKSVQNDPDIRFLTLNFQEGRNPEWQLKKGHPPSRWFRELSEDRKEFTLDWTLPFAQWQGKPSKFKAGGLFARKDRDFQQRKFTYDVSGSGLPNGWPIDEFDGDFNELLATDSLLGIVSYFTYMHNGEERYKYNWGVYIQEPKDWIAQYDGKKDITAGYAMVDMPFSNRMRLITGVRFENTVMQVETQDDTVNFKISESDFLPSVNLVYALNSNMNLRAAYGKTLALPTFREAVPYKSKDFGEGFERRGNPDLKRTLIDNFDLRWEWFPATGEIIAISAFYKQFRNPIEEYLSGKQEKLFEWINVDKARVMGMEFEVRKRLTLISETLDGFSLGANLSLVRSRVDIESTELKDIRILNPYRKSYRQMAGQSPYIINLNLTYDNSDLRLASTLYYNVFGERLAYTTEGGSPDVYEQPFHLLNYSLSWKFMKYLGAKFSVKNLLNSSVKQVQKFKDTEFINVEYSLGRIYSLEFKYEL